jgi:penicillin amidase
LGKGLAFQLSFDSVDLDLTILAAAYGAAGQALGFDGLALLLEDVSRSAPFDPTVSIPPPASGTAGGEVPPDKAGLLRNLDQRAAELAKRYRDKAMEVPLLKRAFERSRGDGGSNWWIVSGERSASGHSMLANDPHLGLITPAIFYEAHLISSAVPGCGLAGSSGAAIAFRPVEGAAGAAGAAGAEDKIREVGLNVNGVSFAGAPGIVQGCNDSICWGSTVNPMDVTDYYLEVLVVDPVLGVPVATVFDGQPEPLVFIPQTFLVNQVGDGTPDNLADAGVGPLEGGVTLVVPRRNAGPILTIDASQQPVTALSVQYTGWRATFEFEAFRLLSRASNVDEFAAGLQYFDFGSQNFGYADVDGNIAYFTSAEMPIREDLQNLNAPDGGIPPFFVRDGTHTLQHEWLPVQNPQPAQALGFEILPFGEMPQLVNPDMGYIINANNDPIGTTLDNNPLNQLRPGGGLYYLNPGYADLRIGRIGRLIEALLDDGNRANPDDLMAMQANNQLLDAELVAPFVVAAFANAADIRAPAELQQLAQDPGVAEAVTRLMAWDYSTPTGIAAGYDPGDDPDNLPQPSFEEINASVAATIWSVYRGQLTRNVVDQTLAGLGLGDFLPGNGEAYKAVYHLLQTFDQGQGVGASGVDFFHGPAGLTPEQERDFVLLQNLRAALDLLAGDEFAPAFGNSTDQDDYRWGYLHRIVFDHPLDGPFSVPPAGGFQHLAPELPGVARSGGYRAVDASSHSARADGLNDFMFGAGPARRFVGVLDPAGVQGHEILPGGQSGVVISPFYSSQLGRWLTNGYHPMLFTPEDVLGDVVSAEQFVPRCVPGPFTLCFRGGRFKAEMTWAAPPLGAGPGLVVPGSSEVSGNFFFFSPENWEMLVKVLDGCDFNGHYWVFASGATDLSWELTVEDTESGEIWAASNPLGQRSPAITDTQAFSTCP